MQKKWDDEDPREAIDDIQSRENDDIIEILDWDGIEALRDTAILQSPYYEDSIHVNELINRSIQGR